MKIGFIDKDKTSIIDTDAVLAVVPTQREGFKTHIMLKGGHNIYVDEPPLTISKRLFPILFENYK